MSLQPVGQPRSSSSNGFNRRRFGRDNMSRMENKSQTGRLNHSSRVINAGISSTRKAGGSESLTREQIIYYSNCLIGHHVEVQQKNGSVYSGIFHAAEPDQGFGIVLKMARLTNDLSSGGQKSSNPVSQPMIQTLFIPPSDLVQVVAKDVAVTRDGIANELRSQTQRDIMLDSNISRSRHAEVDRELEPWMPDEDDIQRPELENVFDSPWTGSWDQFKVNERLFGVKSTFNEELYTTKLERGPRTRELEEEALRIAREIEGEETHDLHLAEERGTFPHGSLDVDEETKYSSVYRGVDDSGYEDEDVMENSRDVEAFGDSARPAFDRSFADVTSGKNTERGIVSSGFLSKDSIQSAKFDANCEQHCSGSLALDHSSAGICGSEDNNRMQENHVDELEGNTSIKETKQLNEEVQTAESNDLQSSLIGKRGDSEKTSISSMAARVSNISMKGFEKPSSGEVPRDLSGKVHGSVEPTNSFGRPSSSASSTSESGVATACPSASGMSPSSSVSSLSSEKSTLNPNAKEFKLNPNAKSFVPIQSPLRPMSPVNDGSFYFPATVPTQPHMQGMPVGMGGGPSYVGHQPMLYNPQAATMQSPGGFFPPNGPQYGQQMIFGHPRQVMYMPGYPAEMQYKGRDF